MHVLLRAQGYHLGASAPQNLRDSYTPAPTSSHSAGQWETCVAAPHLQMEGHMQVQGSPVVAWHLAQTKAGCRDGADRSLLE